MKLIKFIFFILFVAACNTNQSDTRYVELTIRSERQALDIENLKTRLAHLERKNLVDLTYTSFQSTDNPFYNVAIRSVDPHLTGLKIKGEILNMSATKCLQCVFKINIGDRNQDFTISEIRSGSVGSFEVYIPNIPQSDSEYADIEYMRGTISYHQGR